MMYDPASLHAFAKGSIARGSKSFALASQLFDRETRERVWLLYAWCRAADDLTDGQAHGGAMAKDNDGAAALATIRARTDAAFAGRMSGDPAFDALGLLLTKVAIPRPLIDDIVAGFALDVDDWRPRSEADMLRYCYHVAGAVGVAMALVMGIAPDDEATLDRACDLGLAFQLANIARDVAEDAAADRCYLPMEWMVELDIPPGQHMHPAFRARLSVMSKWLAGMAEEYEASARWGARKLPRAAAGRCSRRQGFTATSRARCGGAATRPGTTAPARRCSASWAGWRVPAGRCCAARRNAGSVATGCGRGRARGRTDEQV